MNKAVAFLQEMAGPCYPLLFLKMGPSEWTPVGEEMLYSVVPGKNDTAALVICDRDGNSKAMSSMLPESKARELSSALEKKGIPRYDGDVKLPI